MALRSALLLALPAIVSATKGVVSLDELTFDKVRAQAGRHLRAASRRWTRADRNFAGVDRSSQVPPRSSSSLTSSTRVRSASPSSVRAQMEFPTDRVC